MCYSQMIDAKHGCTSHCSRHATFHGLQKVTLCTLYMLSHIYFVHYTQSHTHTYTLYTCCHTLTHILCTLYMLAHTHTHMQKQTHIVHYTCRHTLSLTSLLYTMHIVTHTYTVRYATQTFSLLQALSHVQNCLKVLLVKFQYWWHWTHSLPSSLTRYKYTRTDTNRRIWGKDGVGWGEGGVGGLIYTWKATHSTSVKCIQTIPSKFTCLKTTTTAANIHLL